MTSEATDQTQQTSAPGGPIVARAGKYYRRTRIVMVLVLLAYGGWSIYDGFINWPNWPVTHPNEKPKSVMDINFNKALGVSLPPLALILLFRALVLSRGEYRLEDDVVYIPGHPPVPLEKIQMVHRDKWDAKGIADIDYDLSDARTGQAGDRDTFRLDDFVYEREGTDEIFKEIEQTLLRTSGRGEQEGEVEVEAQARVASAPPAPSANRPAPVRQPLTQQRSATAVPAKPAAQAPAKRPIPAAAPQSPANAPTGAKPMRPPGSPPPRPMGIPASGPPKPPVPRAPLNNPSVQGAPPRTPPTRMPPRPKL
jgi:hypothetical protein